MRKPVQQRAIDKRGAILDAAALLFAERGYAGTTLKAILEAAHVGKGSLGHQFDTKWEVANAVVIEGFTMAAAQDDVYPVVQRVVDASIGLAWLTGRVPVVKAAARLATDQDGPCYGHLWKMYIPQVSELLEQARDRGELLPGVDPRRTAKMWVAAYTGIDLMGRLTYDELPGEIAEMNAEVVRGIATLETQLRLNVGVERGRTLIEQALSAREDG